MKNTKRYAAGKACWNTSKFALSERLVCGECGAMYRRTQWIKRDGTREHVWRCINRLEFGKKYCQHSPSLKEPILHEAILNCIRSVYHSKEEILQAMQAAEKKVLFIGEQGEDPEAIRRKIQHIEQEMGSLLVFAAQSEKMEMKQGRYQEKIQFIIFPEQFPSPSFSFLFLLKMCIVFGIGISICLLLHRTSS